MAQKRKDYEYYDPWLATRFGIVCDEKTQEQNQPNGHKKILDTYKIREESLEEKEKTIAELYYIIRSLPGETLKEQLSLFLTLSIIQQFHTNILSTLQTAIQENIPNDVAEILQAFYKQHDWIPPYATDSALDQFNLSPKLLTPQTQTLMHLNQALTHLTQHYPPRHNHHHINLYHHLAEFIRNHENVFELGDLDFDIKRLIHHYLDLYDYKAGDIVQDGCAGTGLLTYDLLYPRNEAPLLQLESSDKLLGQISQQLYCLKENGRQSKHATIKINNPLAGEFGYPPHSADFYISAPKTSYNLSLEERIPKYPFSNITYSGYVTRYSSDALWVQYALYCLKPTGMAFIVVQDGFLIRTGYDALVRKHLVDNNLITAIISLKPEHTRRSPHVDSSLIILNKNNMTSDSSKGDIYFFTTQELQNNLIKMDNSGEYINFAMYPLYNQKTRKKLSDSLGYKDIEMLKSKKEIKDNYYSLCFKRYFKSTPPKDYPNLKESQKAFQKAKEKMTNSLQAFEEVTK